MAGPSKRKREASDRGSQPPHQHAYSPYLGSGEHEMEVANALTTHGGEHPDEHMDDGTDRSIGGPVDTAQMHFGLSEQQADAGVAAFLAQAQQALNQDVETDPDFNIDPAVSERPITAQHEQDPSGQSGEVGDAEDKTGMNEHPSVPAVENGTGPPPETAVVPVKPKHSVGTEMWHANRRAAHKDVERRRRETINEGINALARIVPGAERNNKGGILQRAVQHINEMKQSAQTTEQKNNLERMMFEQSISELTNASEKLKAEIKELQEWKRVGQEAGLSVETTVE